MAPRRQPLRSHEILRESEFLSCYCSRSPQPALLRCSLHGIPYNTEPAPLSRRFPPSYFELRLPQKSLSLPSFPRLYSLRRIPLFLREGLCNPSPPADTARHTPPPWTNPGSCTRTQRASSGYCTERYSLPPVGKKAGRPRRKPPSLSFYQILWLPLRSASHIKPLSIQRQSPENAMQTQTSLKSDTLSAHIPPATYRETDSWTSTGKGPSESKALPAVHHFSSHSSGYK